MVKTFVDGLKKNFKTFFFVLDNTCVCVFGPYSLEHSCPRPREGLSSKGLSLALAPDFLCPWPVALPRMVAPGAGLRGVTLCDVTIFMKIMSKGR